MPNLESRPFCAAMWRRQFSSSLIERSTGFFPTESLLRPGATLSETAFLESIPKLVITGERLHPASSGKALIARAHGCSYVINTREEDLVAKVKEYTKGKGVDVVYDSIGKDTFPASLDCLKPLGVWVSFGQSSGPVPEFKITLLSEKGSLFATRPSLADYTRSRKELIVTANDLFEVVANGKVKIAVNQTYPLAEAAKAQRDLEARLTTGSTVLLP